MKSIIQSAMSCLEARFSVLQAEKTGNAGREILAGYCHANEPDRDDTQPADPDGNQVAILYADIAGYARLTGSGKMPDRRHADEARNIFKACIAASRGKLAHFTGDSMLAEFTAAEDALRCAVNVQLAVRTWNAHVDTGRQVCYRIGIGAGEATTDQSDKAIGLSARLKGLARTSGICVSRSVRERIREESKFRFVSLGKRYLRDVHEPVEAFWIEIDAAELGDLTLPESDRISTKAS